MPQYGKITTHHNVESSAEKKGYTEKTEYIKVDDAGYNTSVNIYNNGFVYKSKKALLDMQKSAVPSTEEEYLNALNSLPEWERH